MTLPEERTTKSSALDKNITSSDNIPGSYKSSDNLVDMKSIKCNTIERGKCVQRMSFVISISTILLLLVLIISVWWPQIQNGGSNPENTTSVTVTNVVITPCGNYFWHSAGGSGGNWLPSNAAIQKDANLLEEASKSGVDWGYNGVLGNNSHLLFI